MGWGIADKHIIAQIKTKCKFILFNKSFVLSLNVKPFLSFNIQSHVLIVKDLPNVGVVALVKSRIELPNGNFEVGVHIADVTHYVRPGSVVDEEARTRGTSVYLVDRTIPMLPEVRQALLQEKQHQEDFEITCKARINGYTDFIFVNRLDVKFISFLL